RDRPVHRRRRAPARAGRAARAERLRAEAGAELLLRPRQRDEERPLAGHLGRRRLDAEPWLPAPGRRPFLPRLQRHQRPVGAGLGRQPRHRRARGLQDKHQSYLRIERYLLTHTTGYHPWSDACTWRVWDKAGTLYAFGENDAVLWYANRDDTGAFF